NGDPDNEFFRLMLGGVCWMENDECRNPSELMSVVRIKRIGYFSKWRAHDEDLPFDIAVLEVDDLTQHPE
ncbi:hypothetical protein AAVH_37380, partial [Aphelenchoides avenae]